MEKTIHPFDAPHFATGSYHPAPIRAYTSANQSPKALPAILQSGVHGAEVRCVFPTAWYEPAESGAVSVVDTPSCASGKTHPAPWQRGLRFLADSLITAIAPCDCRVCDSPLARAGDCPICEPCLTALSGTPLQSGGCRICSEPLGFDFLHAVAPDDIVGLCHRCVANPPKFVKATAWGNYEDLRPVIHLLKFEGVPGLARPLGRRLAQAILALRADAPDAMTVIPVPIYRGRREYNQSLLLARVALRHVRTTQPGWSLQLQPELLKRIAHTESQYLLSPAQRRENVRNAFVARPHVADKHILLIDDVYTTGATAAECTRMLLKAGAASVRVVTLARAVRDGAVRWQPTSSIPARDGPLLFRSESTQTF